MILPIIDAFGQMDGHLFGGNQMHGVEGARHQCWAAVIAAATHNVIGHAVALQLVRAVERAHGHIVDVRLHDVCVRIGGNGCHSVRIRRENGGVHTLCKGYSDPNLIDFKQYSVPNYR